MSVWLIVTANAYKMKRLKCFNKQKIEIVSEYEDMPSGKVATEDKSFPFSPPIIDGGFFTFFPFLVPAVAAAAAAALFSQGTFFCHLWMETKGAKIWEARSDQRERATYSWAGVQKTTTQKLNKKGGRASVFRELEEGVRAMKRTNRGK